MATLVQMLAGSPRTMTPKVARLAVKAALERTGLASAFRVVQSPDGTHLGWTFLVRRGDRESFGWISRFGLIDRFCNHRTRRVAEGWLRIGWEGIVRPVTPHVPGECSMCAQLSVELISTPFRSHPDAVRILRRMDDHERENMAGPTDPKGIVAYSRAIHAHQ